METLERLFPETPHRLTETAESASEDINETISVVMLGGESTVLEYRHDTTVYAVKKLVEERLGPSLDKQRLLYKDKELMVSVFLALMLGLTKDKIKFNSLFSLTTAFYLIIYIDRLSLTASLSEQKADDKLN